MNLIRGLALPGCEIKTDGINFRSKTTWSGKKASLEDSLLHRTADFLSNGEFIRITKADGLIAFESTAFLAILSLHSNASSRSF